MIKILHVDDVYDPSNDFFMPEAFHQLHTFLQQRDIEISTEGRFEHPLTTFRHAGSPLAIILDLSIRNGSNKLAIDFIRELNKVRAGKQPLIIVYTKLERHSTWVKQAEQLGAKIFNKEKSQKTYEDIYEAITGSRAI